jgi:hypothetical protein
VYARAVGVGEISGGLSPFNYPGTTGLPKGAVFGRIAGQAAAKRAKECENGSEGGNARIIQESQTCAE